MVCGELIAGASNGRSSERIRGHEAKRMSRRVGKSSASAAAAAGSGVFGGRCRQIVGRPPQRGRQRSSSSSVSQPGRRLDRRAARFVERRVEASLRSRATRHRKPLPRVRLGGADVRHDATSEPSRCRDMDVAEESRLSALHRVSSVYSRWRRLPAKLTSQRQATQRGCSRPPQSCTKPHEQRPNRHHGQMIAGDAAADGEGDRATGCET